MNPEFDTDKKPDICSQSEGDETLARMDANSAEAKDLIDLLVSHPWPSLRPCRFSKATGVVGVHPCASRLWMR